MSTTKFATNNTPNIECREHKAQEDCAAFTIRVYYDNVTEDYCAETDECDGIIGWGNTEDAAERAVLRDLIAYRRQAREEREHIEYSMAA